MSDEKEYEALDAMINSKNSISDADLKALRARQDSCVPDFSDRRQGVALVLGVALGVLGTVTATHWHNGGEVKVAYPGGEARFGHGEEPLDISYGDFKLSLA